MTQKLGLGAILVLLISLLPGIIWFLIAPFGPRFADLSSISTSIGQITGLIGMAMMSLVVILSARPIFLDRIFNGLNNLYDWHRRFGVISFLLILIHPLTIAVSYIPYSLNSAALVLMPGSDWSRNFGILALALMMVIIALTVLLKTKYQILKILHKSFALVFILSVLHTFSVSSDISRHAVLYWYMFFLQITALTFLSYRTLLGALLVKKYIYFVKEIIHLPAKTIEISMVPIKRHMDYFAGQFVFVSFHNAAISSETHPFSISSSPNSGEVKILVKSLGDYTSQMKNIMPGAKVKIEGPFGALCYSKAQNKNQIWIAGGSGIAPFLGMARDLETSQESYNVDLYYCASCKDEIVLMNELSSINPASGKFNFIPFCQDAKGYLNCEKILEFSGGVYGKDIFLCGPPPMVRALKKEFKKIKIPKKRIHSEEFQLL